MSETFTAAKHVAKNLPYFLMSLTRRNLKCKMKKFAKSFKHLSSSLVLMVPELCPRKTTCGPAVFTQLLDLDYLRMC